MRMGISEYIRASIGEKDDGASGSCYLKRDYLCNSDMHHLSKFTARQKLVSFRAGSPLPGRPLQPD